MINKPIVIIYIIYHDIQYFKLYQLRIVDILYIISKV